MSGWELELGRLGVDLCLGDWLARASAMGHAQGRPVRLAVATGRRGPAIVRHAARRHRDLVVLGRRAGGRWGSWRGGTGGYVRRRAPCAILIVD